MRQLLRKFRVLTQGFGKYVSGGFRVTRWDLYIWLILSICSCACVLIFNDMYQIQEIVLEIYTVEVHVSHRNIYSVFHPLQQHTTVFDIGGGRGGGGLGFPPPPPPPGKGKFFPSLNVVPHPPTPKKSIPSVPSILSNLYCILKSVV